ncbi:MAG: RNA polymerase sigma-70 factor (ECF subfamily), partial [Maribacter sp.]
TSKSNLARARILLKEKIETKVLQTIIGIAVMVGNYF